MSSHLLNCTANILDSKSFFKQYDSCENHYLHSFVETDFLLYFKVSLEMQLQCNGIYHGPLNTLICSAAQFLY